MVRIASKKKNLKIDFPKIAKEWHPTKNVNILPEQVLPTIKKKFWWLCKKNHSYLTSVGHRTRKGGGTGCPYCAGRKLSIDNSLQAISPKIAKEWHLKKNKNLKPQDVLNGTRKKVWWKCPKGHEYFASIASRTNYKSTGCPFCSGKKVSKENNLLKKSPHIAKEWHPTKNGELKPSDVVNGSSKKVWWLCLKGHEYKTSIAHRTDKKNPTRCPYCSNNKVSKDNNLEFLFPEISRQWHPSKNKRIKPNAILPGSPKNYWWKCKLGHEYTTSPWQKTKKNKPIICPICSGRRVSKDNNLLKKFPKIGREWHDIKNAESIPNEFTYGSNFDSWWKCKKGHEWKAQIKYRTSTQLNCPQCKSGIS